MFTSSFTERTYGPAGPYDQCSKTLWRHSVGALRDLDEVVAELRAHRPLHHADGCAEYDFVEFAHHLAAAEIAECAAVAARGAAGMFFRDLCEVGTVFDGLLQLVALGFGVDEDMTCRGSCHGLLLIGVLQDHRLTHFVAAYARAALHGLSSSAPVSWRTHPVLRVRHTPVPAVSR